MRGEQTPPTARQSKGEGIRGGGQGGTRDGEGAPTPLGEGGGCQRKRPEPSWLGSLTSRGGAAKPRQTTNNRPEISKGPGDGAVEAGG